MKQNTPSVNQSRGLSNIPSDIQDALPPELIKQLAEDGHGLSFPEPSGCQLRVVREGKTHGNYYAYAAYGGILEAVNAAINASVLLRHEHRITGHLTRDHVHWVESYRHTRGHYEYSYRVFIKVNGKVKCKSFFLGSNRPSPDKQLHAFRTARLFYHFYEIYGEQIMDHWNWFSRWRDLRLYYPDQPPFDWHGA